jgi:acyl carrier protein
MNHSAIEKLESVFRAVFELPANGEVAALRQGKSEKWDSLAHVSLIAAIESEFGVSLDASTMLRIKSFDDAVRILEEQGL